ncbi:hypothetical protein [Pseudaminobacter sp. NGMCC 1.201702]|uniref:hypothetical protein n=1 Tax=Pseudaminobacter sp. NGMCC 1.201702 TaxID=3391825 RepID=UPI0039F0F0B8
MPIKALPTTATHTEAPESPIDSVHIVPVPLAKAEFGDAPTAASHAAPHIDWDHDEGSEDTRTVNDEVHAGEVDSPDNATETSGDAHTIRVIQTAEVDQDARIIVEGYVGEVVARLHIDQDLLMDQDVEIAFSIDGNGNFSVLVDQDMRIDQQIDIDVDIREEDGVLYLDVFLRDRIEVEQDTVIGMHVGDGPAGGTVEVSQDIELDQDVDIDIDIEDDLEERYVIDVRIDVRQEVATDQDAIVAVSDDSGEIDMDVEATQVATVDQETIIRADFALV